MKFECLYSGALSDQKMRFSIIALDRKVPLLLLLCWVLLTRCVALLGVTVLNVAAPAGWLLGRPSHKTEQPDWFEKVREREREREAISWTSTPVLVPSAAKKEILRIPKSLEHFQLKKVKIFFLSPLFIHCAHRVDKARVWIAIILVWKSLG
jgi:hypothetical protein